MDSSILCPPSSSPAAADSIDTISRFTPPHSDLIFVQDLGMVAKQIVSPGRVSPALSAERKWLGADFSHIIVSISTAA